MSPSLHGRAEELALLEGLLVEARAGSGRALAIVADAGAGKSALLGALERAAPDLRVMRLTGIPAESEVPFAAIELLLRPLLPEALSLPRTQQDALDAAIGSRPGRVDVLALGTAVLSLLSDARPALVLVDDGHWIDEASASVLAFVARRLAHEAIALVVAMRDTGAAGFAGLPRLLLEPLPDDACRALLDDLSGRRLPRELADEIVAAAQGSPLLVHELAASLTPDLLRGGEAWIGPPEPGEHARDLLGRRLEQLDPPTRRAVLVTAAAGVTDRHVILAALEHLGGSGADLLAAEDAGILALEPGQVGVRHPLLRSLAYHGATPGERRSAHAALAATAPAGDPRRPWHAAAAAVAPDEDVAAALEALASGAPRDHGFAGRARRRAAALSPSPDARIRRLLDAAENFLKAGNVEDVQRVLDELPRDRGRDADRLQAALELTTGRPASALPKLVAQATSLREVDPPSAASRYVDAAYACMLLGDTHGWHAHAVQAAQLAPASPDPLALVARAMRAAAAIAGGRVGELEDLDAALDAVLGDPEGARLADAAEVYGLLGHALVWTERFGPAESLLEALITHARATAATAALPFPLAVRAVSRFRRGRWADALASANESVDLAELTHQQSHLAGTLGVRAIIRAWRGDDAMARSDGERALTLSDTAAPRLAIHARTALGASALGLGELPAAISHFEAAGRAHSAAGIVEPGSMPWQPDLIEALLLSRRTSEAEDLLGRWEEQGRTHGRGFARVSAARLRGLLIPDETVDEHFAPLIRDAETLGLPLELARARLAWGERLRRARRKQDSRVQLRGAIEGFEDLGAKRWAARARRELRAAGGQVPPVRRAARDELTAQELQIALMAAAGRTNKEVAAALFVSPRTVEHHLTTIFRKLTVHRRTELPGALERMNLVAE